MNFKQVDQLLHRNYTFNKQQQLFGRAEVIWNQIREM